MPSLLLAVLSCCSPVLRAGPIAVFSTAPESTATNALVYWSEHMDEPRPLQAHFLRIDLQDPHYEVFTMISEDPDGNGQADARLEPPEQLAERHHALAAINANAFQSLSKLKSGLADTDWFVNKPIRITGVCTSNQVVRSRETASHFMFWIGVDGKAHMGNADTNDVIKEAVSDWSGYLVHRGKAIAISREKLHPRTLLGLDKSHRWLFMAVIDGRQPEISEGLNLYEAGQLMKKIGCHEAIALDGGGSSIMVTTDQDSGTMKVMNHPADGKVRPIPVMLGVRLVHRK